MDVTLGYRPREQFVDFHLRVGRWACMICHRRSGKTYASLMDLIDHAAHLPNSRWAYIAPLRNQAKTVAWDYLKDFSRPLCRKPPNEAELRVDFANGARITIFGADNPDALRGMALDGVVLDEYADMAPSLFSHVVRPALADRNGLAVVLGTIKGRNQLWQKYQEAKNDASWYTTFLRGSETGILPSAELAETARMMTPEAYAAEIECDPYAGILGAYYSREMADAEHEGRLQDDLPVIQPVPAKALPAGHVARPVSMNPAAMHCAWDLGNGANMAIWAFQVGERGPLVHDFIQIQGFYFEDYIKELIARGYDGIDYLPHDARVPSFETGRTRVETMRAFKRHPQLVPDHKIEDGINAARMTLRVSKFNAVKCASGLEALRQYRQEWDDKARVFKKTAAHDWASHASDAWRYLSMAWRQMVEVKEPPPKPLFTPTNELTIGDYIKYGKMSNEIAEGL
jgi:phage terminase large subunit